MTESESHRKDGDKRSFISITGLTMPSRISTSSFKECQITALIGPSGCGKSTFLRTLNRLNELIPHTRIEGTITIDGEDIYQPGTDVVSLRQRVGMVFQRPNPFPKSIFDNVAFGPKVCGLHTNREIEEKVEQSLKAAALWPEVSDRLYIMP